MFANLFQKMSSSLKTWPASIAVVALAFTAACGSEPAPAATPAAPERAAAAPAKQPKAPAENKSVESRADEIIADLKKREEEQAKIHEKVTGRVPVVVEVSPTRGSSAAGGMGPGASGRYYGTGVYPGSSPTAGINSSDANYWRQEFSIASARLQTSQRRLEDARRRMNEASQQMNTPNAALRKMGEEAYQRAQQEYGQAQAALYEDQSAVNRARSAALSAGVPPTALR
jgi:hypothetical protein